MQAIILAAGYGKRLKPITNKIPKSLVKVNGTPLLINTLNILSGFDIDEVIIVVGHKKEAIINEVGHTFQGMKIIYVENPAYIHTNNVYSLYLTKNYVHDDVIMFECDLFYRQKLVDTIMQGDINADCNILVSPYDPNIMDGTVIRVDSDGNAKELIIKRDQNRNFDYTNAMKTVNVYTFKRNFIIKKFLPAIELYVKTQSVNSYYELVLGSLIYYGNDNIKVVKIAPEEWCEIDTVEDLENAARLFEEE